MRILESHTVLRATSLLLVGAVLAVVTGQQAMLVPALLSLTALIFAAAFLDRIEAGDRPAVERDWGGLGMEPGGWHLSASLAYLVAAVAFGVMSVAGLGIAMVATRPPVESEHAAQVSRREQPESKPLARPLSGPSGEPASGAGAAPKHPAPAR